MLWRSLLVVGVSVGLVALVGCAGSGGDAGAAAETEGAGPFEVLEREHEVIGKVVAEAGDEAEAIRSSGEVDASRVGTMVTFFEGFADGCHHRKEEVHLFPALRAEGVSPVLIDRLIGEHERGRALLSSIRSRLDEASAGDEDAVSDVATALDEYAAMMRAHIEAENDRLFREGMRALRDTREAELAEAFEQVEEALGEGFHERYHAMAMSLIEAGG